MCNKIKVNPNDIPDADFETGCSILDTSVRRFFSLPGIQEEYDEWMKTEEGQMADLPPKERKKRLEAVKKKLPVYGKRYAGFRRCRRTAHR